MHYHKSPKNRRVLALLLTGSLLFGGIPVYAGEYSNVELSAEDDGSDLTVDSDSAADMAASDDTVASEDTNLSIDATDSDVSTDEEGSSIAAANSDKENESDDFSSDDSQEVFSDGTVTDIDSELDYVLGRPMTDGEREAQLAMIPELTDMPVTDEVTSDLDIVPYALYPEEYNSAKEGLVTPVKNQSSTSLCWDFSLTSNIETSLLSRGLGYYDLSEEHLAYFWANRVNDPLANTPNDKITRTNADYHGTGNGQVASFFLSTWSGMTTEEKVPFSSTTKTWPEDLAYDSAAYMEDAVFSEYDEDRVKLLLSEYKSVSAMMYWNLQNYTVNTAAYYQAVPKLSSNGKQMVNHAVTIVGWDDNYKKENFIDGPKPSRNGAWIVKNSYGTGFGDKGYFYMAYDNATFSNLVCNTASTSEEYNNNYFYDGASAGTVVFPGISNGYYASNIFKATAGKGKDEELGEIVTAVPQDNTDFQIQIYTDLTNPSDPTSGTPAYATPMEYTQAFAGIQTIRLEKPVKIPPGTLYSVVLQIPNGSQRYYLEKTSSSSSWFTTVAGIDANQSFYSADGKRWTDAAKSEYCFSIKAHTRTLSTSTVVTPDPDPDETPIVSPAVTPAVSPEITPEIEIPDDTPDTPEPPPTMTPTPTPVSHRINYNKNSSLGVGNMPSASSAQEKQTITVGNAPYCKTRFFAGWNTRSDGRGKSYSPGQKIQLNQNLTLYAQWNFTYVSSARLIYRVVGKQAVTCYGTTNKRITRASIPSIIRYKGITYRVTSVWANAFKNKSRLTTVSIGNNVSVIGKNAFYKCKKLKKVTIGTGLTQINSGAFRGVKKGCTITIKSLKLKKVSSKIDQSTSKMTVCVPRKKYKAYKKILWKKSRTVKIKKF